MNNLTRNHNKYIFTCQKNYFHWGDGLSQKSVTARNLINFREHLLSLLLAPNKRTNEPATNSVSQFDVLNYLQTLLLSKQTLLKFTAGRVIDLISNDVKRMEEETIKFFFLTIFAFFSTAGSMFLITYLISWQAVVGVIFMCFLLPYFAVMSYFSAKLRLRTAAVSDQRISLMNQVVSGIRAIKTHAWEDEYREKIKHTRR